MQMGDAEVLKVRDPHGRMMALRTKKLQNPKELKILLDLQVKHRFFSLPELHY